MDEYGNKLFKQFMESSDTDDAMKYNDNKRLWQAVNATHNNAVKYSFLKFLWANNLADDFQEDIGFEIPEFDLDLNDYNLNTETVEAVDEAVGGDLYDLLDNIIDGNYNYYPGINNAEELGKMFINDMLGGIDTDLAHNYIDVAKLGHDLDMDTYETEDDEGNLVDISAGEYWCGNEAASDEEIGQAFIDAVGVDGISNIKNYFDYEAFGNDLLMDTWTLTSKGAVELV